MVNDGLIVGTIIKQNNTAEDKTDTAEMTERGKYDPSQSGPHGVNGAHVDTMLFGETEGDTSDINIAYKLQDNEADGPNYPQKWEGR